MSRRGWDAHPERRNPVKACVLCLYRVGFGGRTIEKITGTNRSLAIKWARLSGIERSKRKSPRTLVGIFGCNRRRRTESEKRQAAIRSAVRVREYKRVYLRRKDVRVVCNLRLRIYRFLFNGARVISTQELTGCTRQQLMAHIERQFRGQMSWDNYGRWHIDHIIPCAKFDLTKREEKLRCCHWTNLRPLWKRANQEKSDKLVNAQLGLQLKLS
jgi:hypothetical protein